MKKAKTTLIAILSLFQISFFACCKDDIIDSEPKGNVFSVLIDGIYWGTDSVYSRISFGNNQVYVGNNSFRFYMIYPEPDILLYIDSEGKSTFIQDFDFTFTHIDEHKQKYSAVFSGIINKNGTSRNLSGQITNASYFEDWCEIPFNIVYADTFSFLGTWNFVGYHELDSHEIFYPPCNKHLWIRFEDSPSIGLIFKGTYCRNFFGGTFNLNENNIIEFNLTYKTKVYISWNYDREYEVEFFQWISDNQLMTYKKNNNILSLTGTNTGRTYIVQKE